MNVRKLWIVAFAVVFGCTTYVQLARAGEENEKTKVTVDQPIEIPGCVLPAGSYWFVRDTNNLDVVRIFSLDWRTLYATEMTVTADRPKPVDNTAFTLAEREPSRPAALVKWFYPGRTIGHEFLYSKQEEKELAKDRQQTVVSGQAAQPGL
jgi:hypothetical protein